MAPRSAAIVVAVASLFGCVAGCEDRYGAYITVRASTKELAFDRLEIYYGVAIGDTVPTNPKFAMPEPIDTRQLVVARAFAPDDVQMFGARRTEYTVWIPDGGENDALGAYALAIAYAGTQRVAVGELFDFEVPTGDIVYKYTIDLEPVIPASIYEWGRGDARCLRYDRDRGAELPAVVAVVDRDDSDCDLFPDRSDVGNTDCEPLLYCDGSGESDCIGRTPCLNRAAACNIGSCANKDGVPRACANDICVSDLLCAMCDLSRSTAEILDCALLGVETHPSDVRVITRGNFELCNDPTLVDIELPFPCTNPSIDAVVYFAQRGARFDFAIEPGASPNVCRLTIASTTTTLFDGSPHLLITVEIPPQQRTGFVVGLLGEGGSCPAPGSAQQVTHAPLVGTCPGS
ncbi:MAG: hypothetical protein ACKV2T_23950 [Kofleriaceae bacterium]